ncbi:hypothetical protein CGU37_26980 [Pseudomonas fluorescens]|nr:hypothetical protein CGU37_26980 [Pseudomonas fluorescens]
MRRWDEDRRGKEEQVGRQSRFEFCVVSSRLAVGAQIRRLGRGKQSKIQTCLLLQYITIFHLKTFFLI